MLKNGNFVFAKKTWKFCFKFLCLSGFNTFVRKAGTENKKRNHPFKRVKLIFKKKITVKQRINIS